MEKDRLRVLLVEDDEDDRRIVEELLSQASSGMFHVDWVMDYDAGLEAISTQEHDVYLLDYRLGDRSGLELLRELMVKGNEAPIIFLTGQSGYEIEAEAIRMGAADYLVKGQLTSDQLQRSIRYSMARKQVENELRRYRDTLEEQVQERTVQLRRTNESLELEIAERKRAQEELGQLVVKLQDALAKVKTLSGLLPICASCKKIRDDQGYWQQIEAYVSEHSEAEFSHAICPDCVKKLYPWYLGKESHSEREVQSGIRRRDQRFQVQMRTTIALSASDEGDFSKVGDMIDISKGGLSFRHPTSEEVPFGLVKLTLIGHTQPTVFINEIPCKIVYEFALPAQSGSSEHPSKSYRMGVRFEGLSEHQRSQLDHFIQIHGTPDDKLMD